MGTFYLSKAIVLRISYLLINFVNKYELMGNSKINLYLSIVKDTPPAKLRQSQTKIVKTKKGEKAIRRTGR